MSSPVSPGKPTNIVSTIVGAADTTTTGVKASYTVPAARAAFVRGATLRVNSGTNPQCSLQLVRGGTTLTLQAGGSNVQLTPGIWALAGDIVQWNCTAAGATSNTDFGIFADEYEVG